jgi:hypothetical protein
MTTSSRVISASPLLVASTWPNYDVTWHQFFPTDWPVCFLLFGLFFVFLNKTDSQSDSVVWNSESKKIWKIACTLDEIFCLSNYDYFTKSNNNHISFIEWPESEIKVIR